MERTVKEKLFSELEAYFAQQEGLVAAYLFGSLAEEMDHRRTMKRVICSRPER